MIRIYVVAAEESRQNNIAPQCLPHTPLHQIVGNNPEQRTQVKDVPGFLPEDFHARIGANNRIAFARDGLDQRRFATTVRAENGNVFPAPNLQIESVEHNAGTATDLDVMEIEEQRSV